MNKTLSEVYAVILAMGKAHQIRIPEDVWNTICEKRDKDYTPFVDENKALDEQSLSKDTITFIAMLHRDYWCDSEEEKAELTALFEKNEENYNQTLLNAGSTRELMKLLRRK